MTCQEEEEPVLLDVSKHAGLGFALVVCAGLATSLGAIFVYYKSIVQLASDKVLACSVAISAGVMLYVSFVEIFWKAKIAFVADGKAENDAYTIATVCLFAGIVVMKLVGCLVHRLDNDHHAPPRAPTEAEKPIDGGDVDVDLDNEGAAAVSVADAGGATAGHTDATRGEAAAVQPSNASRSDAVVVTDAGRAKKLKRMGLNTALAVAIHNFPEGLATFVGTVADPTVGLTLAVAIGIHNIPEGLCVAIPIYYATGDRMKAFLCALISGLSEPIGALVGYLILKSSGDDMSQQIYGILFGMVAGMMIAIVLFELLPVAHRYDPNDQVVSNCVVLGMAVMAASLILFQY